MSLADSNFRAPCADMVMCTFDRAKSKMKSRHGILSFSLTGIVPAVIALMSGCGSGYVSYTEAQSQSSAGEQSSLPIKIRHLSADSTAVIGGIKSEEIYFAPSPNHQGLRCEIECEVLIREKTGTTIKATHQVLQMNRESLSLPFVAFRLVFPISYGEYELEIKATDLNSKRIFRTVTKCTKDPANTGSETTVRLNNQWMAFPNCPVGSELEVAMGSEVVNVTYFSQIPLPPAPFSAEKPSFPATWKSETTNSMDAQKGIAKVSVGLKGLFLFKSNEKPESVEMALATAPHFPEIRKIEELILSVRYIMTKAEFDEIISSKDVKKRLDSFWISNAGSKEKARSMIRTYYNRVITANKMFTCHKEGWQTDRGMIFIVLGPPVNIQSDATGETWAYPRSGLPGNDAFRFNRMQLPYDDNYFELKRSADFKPIWMANVESWRSGRTN